MIALFQLLILQFTAHILADFTFQGQHWSERKASRPFTRHHLWHTFIVFGLSYLLSFDPGFWIAALLIALLHLCQDIMKSAVKVRKDRNLFFTDQLIHLLILAGVSIAYHHYHGYTMPFNVSLRTLAIVFSLLLCLKPANIIIKNILDVIDVEAPGDLTQNMAQEGREEDARGLPNAGKLIGIVERLLAFVLIGTLLSFGIAIFLALMISEL